jgi:hypothetical protein
VAGAEGRCLSTCLPSVAALAEFLPATGCPAGTKCAPCYDPTSSDPTAPTGACSLGCDAPKQPPLELSCPWTGTAVIDPARLPACAPACGGAHCLPERFVPADQRDLLAPCPDGFCTPDPLIQTANNYVPPTCTSIAGAEGRCLSECLPDVAGQPLLPQSTCAPGHRCVPCFDPTSSDPTAATGACSLSCDAPAQPPVVLSCPWDGPAVIDPAKLPACDPLCEGARCLPASYVPGDLADFLRGCTGGFCTPEPFIETAGNFKPPRCAPFSGQGEGRCLSTCLPIIAGQATLERSSCDFDERCAPCVDPLSAVPTGACTVACDAPEDPPYTFPSCCSNEGRCVAVSQIPDGDEGNLQQLSCAGGFLCVPDEQLPGGMGRACDALIYTGTCLSDCLNLGIGEILFQADCPDNHTCIPCEFAPAGSPGC